MSALQAPVAPDETPVCRFRHLLEKHDLGGLMLEGSTYIWRPGGIRIVVGTIRDAVRVYWVTFFRHMRQEHRLRSWRMWRLHFAPLDWSDQ